MLKRDRDMSQYGVARDQRMADASLARRNNTNAHVKHGEERVLCLEEGVAGLTIGLGQEEIMAGMFMTTIQGIRIITEEETLAGFQVQEIPLEETRHIRMMGHVGGVDNEIPKKVLQATGTSEPG